MPHRVSQGINKEKRYFLQPIFRAGHHQTAVLTANDQHAERISEKFTPGGQVNFDWISLCVLS